MVHADSRYARTPDLVHTTADGRKVAYKARQILPQGSRMPVQAEVAVRQGERLDLFAARTLGEPRTFWRIADANDALDPFALVAVPGRLLKVPVPQVEGPLPSLEK